MENLLTNEEFNALVKDIKVEKIDFKSAHLDGGSGNMDDVLVKLKIYWEMVGPVLHVSKLISPPKIDKGIEEFISTVDRLCNGAIEGEQAELPDKFAAGWGTVYPVLETAKDFTSPKADAIINEVIKIGNMITRS